MEIVAEQRNDKDSIWNKEKMAIAKRHINDDMRTNFHGENSSMSLLRYRVKKWEVNGQNAG